MGIHQFNHLVELIDGAFAAKGITSDPRTWDREITFGDVIQQFEETETSDNARDKLRSCIRQFSEWQIFHGQSGIAIEEFLDQSDRLDLSQLDENARNMLADVVLRRLFLLVKAIGPVRESSGWPKFRAYLAIDEAQVLMGIAGDAKASLSRYASEARKFGIGLILATQLKDNIPSDIWGNIDTRLFMQALDPAERAKNAKAANVPDEVLQSLARGEAILTSSSQPHQRPVKVKIEPPWLME
jgi:DNA helicase HerA-like ATPase